MAACYLVTGRLTCDGVACESSYDSAEVAVCDNPPPKRQLREEAAVIGWEHGLSGDLCPSCVAMSYEMHSAPRRVLKTLNGGVGSD